MTVWDKWAEENGNGKPSWDDAYAVELEFSAVRPWIEDAETVLDVGCGNGFAVIAHSKVYPGKSFVGVDSSVPMIEAARSVWSRVRFEVGSVCDLKERADVCYATRCLINLPTWDEQKRGIEQLLKASRKRVVLSEGFWEPLCRLNSLRMTCGLQPLVEHDFNRYIKESRLREFLDKEGLKYQVFPYMSLYYFGSRIFRELMGPMYGPYENPISRFFFEMEKEKDGGDVGVQKLCVIDAA